VGPQESYFGQLPPIKMVAGIEFENESEVDFAVLPNSAYHAK
jgi:hypothetical protein